MEKRERYTVPYKAFGFATSYIGGAREATQKEVADLLGISQSYISRLEKRIIAHLRQEMLKQMQC